MRFGRNGHRAQRTVEIKVYNSESGNAQESLLINVLETIQRNGDATT